MKSKASTKLLIALFAVTFAFGLAPAVAFAIDDGGANGGTTLKSGLIAQVDEEGEDDGEDDGEDEPEYSFEISALEYDEDLDVYYWTGDPASIAIGGIEIYEDEEKLGSLPEGWTLNVYRETPCGEPYYDGGWDWESESQTVDSISGPGEYYIELLNADEDEVGFDEISIYGASDLQYASVHVNGVPTGEDSEGCAYVAKGSDVAIEVYPFSIADVEPSALTKDEDYTLRFLNESSESVLSVGPDSDPGLYCAVIEPVENGGYSGKQFVPIEIYDSNNLTYAKIKLGDSFLEWGNEEDEGLLSYYKEQLTAANIDLYINDKKVDSSYYYLKLVLGEENENSEDDELDYTWPGAEGMDLGDLDEGGHYRLYVVATEAGEKAGCTDDSGKESFGKNYFDFYAIPDELALSNAVVTNVDGTRLKKDDSLPDSLPSITVKMGETTLTKDEDYAIEYRTVAWDKDEKREKYNLVEPEELTAREYEVVIVGVDDGEYLGEKSAGIIKIVEGELAEADVKAAAAVEAQIKELPDKVTSVSEHSAGRDAYAAYDKLTDTQKKLIFAQSYIHLNKVLSSAQFYIKNKSLKELNVTISIADAIVKMGKKPGITVKQGENELVVDTEYNIEYSKIEWSSDGRTYNTVGDKVTVFNSAGDYEARITGGRFSFFEGLSDAVVFKVVETDYTSNQKAQIAVIESLIDKMPTVVKTVSDYRKVKMTSGQYKALTPTQQKALMGRVQICLSLANASADKYRETHPNEFANPMKVKAKKIKAKAKKLKKKAVKVAAKKAFVVSGAQGSVTYKLKKITVKKKLAKQAKKKIKVSKDGKITLKKGLKKGTYKLSVQVTAAGNDFYDAGTKTVTVKVKVK